MSAEWALDDKKQQRQFDRVSFRQWIELERGSGGLSDSMGEFIDDGRHVPLALVVVRRALASLIPPDFDWCLEVQGDGLGVAVFYRWKANPNAERYRVFDCDVSIVMILLESVPWDDRREEAASGIRVA